MATRSAALAVTTVPTGDQTVIYQVADDQVAIVKSLSILRASGEPSRLVVYANRPVVAIVQLYASLDVRADTAYEKSLWHVLEHGDQLSVSVDGGTIWIWVSGTELPRTSS
jgi:hypothetical protein